MTRSAVRNAFVFALVLLVLAACGGREKKSDGATATDTIAPAAAQPEETGTDAMTQTVEIQDGRSEAEGGGLTSPNPPVVVPGSAPASATTGTSTTNTTTTTTTTATPPTTTTR